MGIVYQDKDFTVGPYFPIVYRDGLDITILGANLDVKNADISVPSDTLTLDASTTNYVYIDWTTKTLAANSSGYPDKAKPLYEITTDATDVTAIADKRAVIRVSPHSEFKTKTTPLFSGAANSDTGWQTADISSDAPEGATGVHLAIGVQDSGTPGLGVKLSLRKPGETATAQNIIMYPQISGLWIALTCPLGINAAKQFEYRIQPSGTLTYFVALLGWIYGE